MYIQIVETIQIHTLFFGTFLDRTLFSEIEPAKVFCEGGFDTIYR